MEVEHLPDLTCEEEEERRGIVHICRGNASLTSVALSLCAVEREGFLVQAPGDGVHMCWSAHAHTQQKESPIEKVFGASYLGN